MGGGEVVNFPIRRADAASKLSGVIASSMLVHQTHPSPKIQRAIGGVAAIALPYLLIPAPLDYNDLSHDTKYNDMCRADSLSILKGSLRGLSDMLNWGEELLRENYQKWPKSLPILFVHGTGDQITDHTAMKAFHDKIVADDKNVIFYDDGYHELVHEPAHTEKLISDMIAFIEAHVPSPAPESAPVETKL